MSDIHNTPKVQAELDYAERLLEWNRAQENPPIRIGMEYVVAKAAVIAALGNLNEQ